MLFCLSQAESAYCAAETAPELLLLDHPSSSPQDVSEGDTEGLALTAIRSFSWCKQCAEAGRHARGLRAARLYLEQSLAGWDGSDGGGGDSTGMGTKRSRRVSESDAQLAVLLLEDCLDSLGRQQLQAEEEEEADRVRVWSWREAWARWPQWDPLHVQEQQPQQPPERVLRRAAEL